MVDQAIAPLRVLRALSRNPRHLFGHRNIFLLSHMRAYTSLFGHILGSHPQIEGYYEMHIGYYSWKSLWRQKVLYFSTHAGKPGSVFLFDKVLHNEHRVDAGLLMRPGTRTIFALRRPDATIGSVMQLYQKVEPGHAFATPEGAQAYYLDRLSGLAAIAETVAGRFLYLDAELLVEQPQETLERLGEWMGLASPLSTEYQVFQNTGKPKAGDSSDSIKSGKIFRSTSQYDNVELPSNLVEQAAARHVECRSRLVALSDSALVSADN